MIATNKQKLIYFGRIIDTIQQIPFKYLFHIVFLYFYRLKSTITTNICHMLSFQYWDEILL